MHPSPELELRSQTVTSMIGESRPVSQQHLETGYSCDSGRLQWLVLTLASHETNLDPAIVTPHTVDQSSYQQARVVGIPASRV